jgi:glycine betaine/choline ABC-type transport system substrate-binding protein
LIAIAADLALGYFEKTIQLGRRTGASAKKIFVSSLFFFCAAIVIVYFVVGQSSGRIAVGSKDFTEQVILGEILAQSIEDKTRLQVTRRFDLGGNLAHEALIAGEIDTYVEYTGTALLAILKSQPITDPAEVLRRVKKDYAERFGLEWTEPLGFNNTFAVLVRDEDAHKFNLKTISDAAKISPRWRAGFGQDFMSRADGYPGFARTYGFHFAEIREMDLSLTYRALAENQVDLIAGNSTDGLIARYGLIQLVDDRHYFPPYDAVPVVRRAALEQHPEIRDALRQLGGILSVAEMRRLNYAVDGEKRPAREVAREFLETKGILR